MWHSYLILWWDVPPRWCLGHRLPDQAQRGARWRCWCAGCPEISKAVTFVLIPFSWLLLRLGTAKENTTHPISLIQTHIDLWSSLSLGGRKYFLVTLNWRHGWYQGKGWDNVTAQGLYLVSQMRRESCDIKFEVCEPIHFYSQNFLSAFFPNKKCTCFPP